MSHLAAELKKRFFKDNEHPYRIFEHRIGDILRAEDAVLDAGCGRTAPVLRKYVGCASRLVGIDRVTFSDQIPGIELYERDLAHTELPNCSLDLVISRSVLEHLDDPDAVFQEIYRILRPGGRFLFLTPNAWDYVSLTARLVPSRWHPWIVARTEGRAEEDVFPVVYRANTWRAVRRLARVSGFHIESFTYLGQYPSYFMFNGFLFLLASLYEKSLGYAKPLECLRGWIFVELTRPTVS